MRFPQTVQSYCIVVHKPVFYNIACITCDCELPTWHYSRIVLLQDMWLISLSQNVSESWLISIHSLEAKCIQTPSEAHLGKLETVLISAPLLFTSDAWYHIVQTKVIDQGSGWNLFKMKREPRRRMSSPAKHLPGSMSRLHSRLCSTWGKREKKKSGRQKKGGDFNIGFAEGSSWNIHHSMLFFWDPTAVSGGAGVGEWKTRSLVTQRWNSNTARQEMARIQQRKLS